MYGIYQHVEFDWLNQEISLEEAERIVRRFLDSDVFEATARANGVLPDERWVERKAVLAAEWHMVKGQVRPGDTLRLFNTGRESMRNRTSMSGIALVRDGTVITHVAVMSD